jgi:hypothetical protein
MKLCPGVFSHDELKQLCSDQSVVDAYKRLPRRAGKISFEMTVPDSIKQSLQQSFGLDLSTVDRLPFRWIRGDTAPHVDRGQSEFDDTYLVYLTDGEGQFKIGEDSYPIEAGTGFSFSEGTRHEVIETHESTRLLLGPMSEQGFAVGESGTTISADGETTTVYIRQVDGTSSYKLNEDGEWTVFVWPLTVTNTNATPSSNILKVLFTTNLTFIDDYGGYIQTNSEGIQIGDKVLRNDGTKTTITIDNVSGYGGFVLSSYSYTYVYNLKVTAINNSILDSGGGWIARSGYAYGASDTYIIGCSSDGPISNYGGGIVGSYAAASVTEGGPSANLKIIGCSSSGAIGDYAGGIAGEYCAQSGGSVTIIKCSSSGSIALGGGGIVGAYAGQGESSCEVEYSYSTGSIAQDAGGIFGQNAGNDGYATAFNCYSRGTIAGDGGGIFGSQAAVIGGAEVSNCYSAGTFFTEGTGLYGPGKGEGATQAVSYAANGTWDDVTAVGIGFNLVSNFISPGTNQPFELRAFGPSPYSLTSIVDEDMSLTYSQSVAAGSASIAGVVSGYSSYSILEGGDATITINGTTGAISTTTATPVGNYTMIVRATINPYSITTVTLTVTEAPEPEPVGASTAPRSTVPIGFKRLDYDQYKNLVFGNRLVIERLTDPNVRFKSYADYIRYKIARATISTK